MSKLYHASLEQEEDNEAKTKAMKTPVKDHNIPRAFQSSTGSAIDPRGLNAFPNFVSRTNDTQLEPCTIGASGKSRDQTPERCPQAPAHRPTEYSSKKSQDFGQSVREKSTREGRDVSQQQYSPAKSNYTVTASSKSYEQPRETLPLSVHNLKSVSASREVRPDHSYILGTGKEQEIQRWLEDIPRPYSSKSSTDEKCFDFTPECSDSAAIGQKGDVVSKSSQTNKDPALCLAETELTDHKTELLALNEASELTFQEYGNSWQYICPPKPKSQTDAMSAHAKWLRSISPMASQKDSDRKSSKISFNRSGKAETGNEHRIRDPKNNDMQRSHSGSSTRCVPTVRSSSTTPSKSLRRLSDEKARLSHRSQKTTTVASISYPQSRLCLPSEAFSCGAAMTYDDWRKTMECDTPKEEKCCEFAGWGEQPSDDHRFQTTEVAHENLSDATNHHRNSSVKGENGSDLQSETETSFTSTKCGNCIVRTEPVEGDDKSESSLDSSENTISSDALYMMLSDTRDYPHEQGFPHPVKRFGQTASATRPPKSTQADSRAQQSSANDPDPSPTSRKSKKKDIRATEQPFGIKRFEGGSIPVVASKPAISMMEGESEGIQSYISRTPTSKLYWQRYGDCYTSTTRTED